MKGPEIRARLHDFLSPIACSPSCKVIDEVGVPGAVVDVLVIDRGLYGYEIKGATDSRKRLAVQANAYNDVFQRITLVAVPKHIRAARLTLPEWWGLIVAIDGRLVEERPWQSNPDWSPRWLLGMLWRPELEALMRDYAPGKPLSRMSGNLMREYLSDAVPRQQLPDLVSSRMLARTTWSEGRVNPA